MTTNEDVIRSLYAAAEGADRDADTFASLFQDDGYFLDEASGMKWVGQEVRQPIESISRAFPNMHRELLRFYATGDVVIVELRLQGTHLGDFQTAEGILPATGRTFDVPCCDVFHLKDGKVTSFHCYNEFSAWLKQLGALETLSAAVRR